MARSTGIILAVGGITLGTRVLLENQRVDWRIPIATGLAAAVFSGLEKGAGKYGGLVVGVSWIALVTVSFARINGRMAPVDHLLRYWNADMEGKAAS